MGIALTTIDLPLRLDEQGTIRLGQSRVTLDLVIDSYHRGISPESIARQFPSASLADIYGAITYYLQHQAEMDAYLHERAAAASFLEHFKERQEAVISRAELQARLKARQHNAGE
jgi:uncharacterized protein (DUF433 family)